MFKPRFSYKIQDGILYFNFKEAFKGMLTTSRLERVANKKKIKACFNKYNEKGECELILYFKDVFLVMVKQFSIRYPWASKQLADMIQFLSELEDEYKDYSLNMDRITREMKYPPLKHQVDVYRQYESVQHQAHSRGMLLDAAPGTGKTYMSLSLAQGMNIDTVLIICPLPTVENVWLSSLKGEKCLFKNPKDVYFISKNDVSDYVKKDNDLNYIIANYEKIDVILKNIKKLGLSDKTCIIVDESHNFADTKSNRTIGLLDLVNNVDSRNVLLLSGTPVKAKLKELVTIKALLDTNYKKYKAKFDIIFSRISLAEGSMGLTEGLSRIVRDSYADSSINITRGDMKLPDIHYKRIKVKLPNGNKYTLDNITNELIAYTDKRLVEIQGKSSYFKDKLYEYIRNSSLPNATKEKYMKEVNIIIKLRDSDKFKNMDRLKTLKDIENKVANELDKDKKLEFRELVTLVKFPMFKVRGEALGQVFLRKRIECYNDIITKLDISELVEEADKKTVVFSSYIENCEKMYNKMKIARLDPLRVYGEYTKDGDNTVKKFNSGMDIGKDNPLIATYASLSTGVELTNGNTMVLIDLPYRAAEFEQTVSRIWRHGQNADCYIYLVELDTGTDKNINQRTVDIVKHYDSRVMNMTGHGSYQDLDQLNYDSYVADLKFESDLDVKHGYNQLPQPINYSIVNRKANYKKTKAFLNIDL